MDSKKVILLVVTVFDVVAFALAVVAEQRRSKVEATMTDQSGSHCIYDSDISTGLGVGALLFLMVSQVIVTVASKCLCCGKALRPSSFRAWATLLFITSWVTFLIAEVCLLAGSARNAYHTKYRAAFSKKPLSCEAMRKGVFAAGASLTLFTAILSELYFVFYHKASQPINPDTDIGIRMVPYN
ncbi:hypothetical protein NMG60_11014802 [Bertholletia excelsa]